RADRQDARIGRDGVAERGQVLDGGVAEAHREEERAVETGPEAVGQQVVGLAGGHRGRAGTVVGHAEAHAEGGRGQQGQRQGAGVRAIATITATVMPATRPITVTAGIPAMARPQMAMTTVTPANSTADPDVATARPAASSTVMPRRRFSRWRVTMNRA